MGEFEHEEDRLKKSPETWIRLTPVGSRAVCVWTRLKGDKTLMIREDGTFEITHGFSGFIFKIQSTEESKTRGIVRVS